MLQELALLQKNWSHTQSLNSLEVTTNHALQFSQLVEKAVRTTVAKTADNPSQILNWPWRTAEGSHDAESGYKKHRRKTNAQKCKNIVLGKLHVTMHAFERALRWASSAPAKDPKIPVNSSQEYSGVAPTAHNFRNQYERNESRKRTTTVPLQKQTVSLHLEWNEDQVSSPLLAANTRILDSMLKEIRFQH